MKKQVVISAIFFLVFNFCSAFSLIERDISFEKYKKATIHFLDGTSVKGYGKLVGFAVLSTEKYKIKFKASQNDKPDVWTDLMVKGITFHYNFEDVTFLYVKIGKSLYPRLLQVIEEGAIDLYIEIDSYWVTSGFDNTTGFPQVPSYKEEEIYYFLIRKTDGKSLILSEASSASGGVRALFSNFKKG